MYNHRGHGEVITEDTEIYYSNNSFSFPVSGTRNNLYLSVFNRGKK